ncbi:amidase family protein [Dactylosporangium maewongense]|uniref:Amidase family protein n=1 Tax=Dactylosporangium maewongense TaxID=634393 RepID=A0ABN2CW22_9ACTN
MLMSRRRLLAAGGAAALTVPTGLFGPTPGLLRLSGPAAHAGPPPIDPPLAYTGQPPAGEDLCFLPATVQLEWLRRRKVSAVELTQAHLARIARVNPAINAFVYLVPPEQVLAAATIADQRYRHGTHRPLEGLLVGIKDLFDYVADMPNSFGSKPLRDLGFVPPFTSVYVQRLTDAGAIVVGKTATAEFGHKGTTDSLAYGPTSTPWDLNYNAGGSSGGSAAAVAAHLVPLAQGSDAGGSVRIPAALCGVVGFKPSQGHIPQDAPPLPHTPMLTPGPIARTVTDTALLMQVMAGPSPRDAFSLLDTEQYLRSLTGRARGARIAYCPDLDVFPLDPRVRQTVDNALGTIRAAGARVDVVSLGLDRLQVHALHSGAGRTATQRDLADLWLMQQSVLYAHGRDLFLVEGVGVDLLADDVAEQLAPQLVAMIRRGEATSAAEYRHGDFLRIAVHDAFERTLAGYDAILSPTLAALAVPNAADGGTLGPADIHGVPVDPQIGWCLTYLANFSGHPAISIPAGQHGHFPVGMQLIGRRGRDAALLNLAYAIERRRPWVADLPRH